MTAASSCSSRRAAVTPNCREWRFIRTIAEASSALRKLPVPGIPGSPLSSPQRVLAPGVVGEPLSPEAQLASKGRGWSPLRTDFGSSRALPPARHTKDGFPAFSSRGSSRAPSATLNMASTQGCIPAERSADSSREVGEPPPPHRPQPAPSPTAPALPRAAATATAAGAAPPPCQLLSCNGDWAAAAEVTPGRGSGAGPAPERTAESRSSGRGARGRAEEAASAPLLPSLPPGRSREPGRGGHPVRPRSGEARPGSPGAGRGGVTAPSARPRGMHRGSRGRRRHSQVSCGETWRSLRTPAPPRMSLSAVPGPRGGQRGGAGPLALPDVPLGILLGSRDFSWRVLLRPGLPDLPVPTEDENALPTCQCRPQHPRPSSCLHRV